MLDVNEVDLSNPHPKSPTFEFDSLLSVWHQFQCLFLRHRQMAQVVMQMSSPLSGTEISLRFTYVNRRLIHSTLWVQSLQTRSRNQTAILKPALEVSVPECPDISRCSYHSVDLGHYFGSHCLYHFVVPSTSAYGSWESGCMVKRDSFINELPSAST